MNIKTALKSSIKPTLLIIAISFTLSVLFSMVVLYMNRVALAEGKTIGSAIFYFNDISLALGFVYRVVGDLAVIARYVAELSALFLIVQLVYRVFKRR